MNDMNRLLQQLGGNPQMLSQLQSIVGNEQCRSLAEQLQNTSAEELRGAVQRGSAEEIRQAVGQFLSTPDGIRLAEHLRKALGK